MILKDVTIELGLDPDRVADSYGMCISFEGELEFEKEPVKNELFFLDLGNSDDYVIVYITDSTIDNSGTVFAEYYASSVETQLRMARTLITKLKFSVINDNDFAKLPPEYYWLFADHYRSNSTLFLEGISLENIISKSAIDSTRSLYATGLPPHPILTVLSDTPIHIRACIRLLQIIGTMIIHAELGWSVVALLVGLRQTLVRLPEHMQEEVGMMIFGQLRMVKESLPESFLSECWREPPLRILMIRCHFEEPEKADSTVSISPS